MNTSININRSFVVLIIPVLMFAGLAALIKSPLFAGSSEALSLGVTVDLLLTVPLVYFFLIRKTSIHKTTIIPVMIIGMIIGILTLPTHDQRYLTFFRTWIFPLVELFVLTLIVVKLRAAIKKHRGHSPDFFTTLKGICREILPEKAVALFATEVAVVYYAFISWRSRPLRPNEFSYHKNGEATALFGVVIFLTVAETFITHILLLRWSHTAAWILTGFSIYAVVQIFSFLKSLSKRPVVIGEDSLLLRYGILNEAQIPLKDIAEIEFSSKTIDPIPLVRKISPLGDLISHNVMVHLKKEYQLNGLYGSKKNFTTLAFRVDDEDAFKECMRKSLKRSDIQFEN